MFSDALTEGHKEVALEALRVAGYEAFDAIGFSRGTLDTGTRGAFVKGAEHVMFLVPDGGAAPLLYKAEDEAGETRVKQALAQLAEKVATPLAKPVAVQEQAEFDLTPGSEADDSEADEPTKPERPAPRDLTSTEKALYLLKALNADLAPLLTQRVQETDLQEEFLKSQGAHAMTPAMRVRFARFVTERLDAQLAKLAKAKVGL